MIAIIDYQAGNQTSVYRALVHLGIPCIITAESEEILTAERVIFPGVGAAGKAMDVIFSRGLGPVIREVVRQGTPFLGICLGSQIILDRSEENNTACLGLISGSARKFPDHVKVIPHMGWNTITVKRPHPILAHLDPRSQFYFVHSFYPEPTHVDALIAVTDYGIEFASVIGKANVVATQFHPEKSGPPGLQLLKNFSEWTGEVATC